MVITLIVGDGRKVSEAEQKRLDEYNGAITDWMESRAVWLAVQRAVTIAVATKASSHRRKASAATAVAASVPQTR